MSTSRTNWRIVFPGLLLLGIGQFSARLACADNQQAETAAPRPLSATLEQICREAGLQLVYSSYLTKGLTSAGAAPGGSVQDKLREVLTHTNLTFEFVNDHTVTIVRVHKIGPTEDKSAPSAFFKASRATPPSWTASESRADALSQVIVTGTHLIGVTPVGAQVITVTRQQINQMNAGTVEEVVRTDGASVVGFVGSDLSEQRRSDRLLASIAPPNRYGCWIYLRPKQSRSPRPSKNWAHVRRGSRSGDGAVVHRRATAVRSRLLSSNGRC